MTWEQEVEEIEQRRERALQMGGEERVAQQHDSGKLTVRERIDELVDPGSFRERGVLAGSVTYEDGERTDFMPASFVMGRAKVDGRPIVVGGGDFTARGRPAPPGRGGGGANASKGGQAELMALELKVPMVRLIDGFGADIRSVEGMARTYIPANPNYEVVTAMMSEIPVVSVALGSVAGFPAAQVAASHFAVMVKGTSQVFAAGPPVVVRALGLVIDKEDLGGYQIHARGSGLVDNEAEDEADAIRQTQRFLSYLPGSVWELPPVEPSDDPADRCDEELSSIIPRERQRPYDTRAMVAHVVDRDSSFEIGRYFGSSLVTMFARIRGYPVGVIANDPLRLGGAMNGPAADKMAKFVDLCDTFHLPVVNFVDQPGFMLGPVAEGEGTLKRGVRALAAIYEATVPWASVVVRRVYGVAGAGHQNHSRFNMRIAWPSGEWGSLPIEGGVMAAYRRQIEAADDPDAFRTELEERLIAMRSPFGAAEAFNIEEIIDPKQTRPLLADWVEMAYRMLPSTVGKKARGMRP